MRYSRALCATAVLTGLLACSGPAVQYDYDAKADFSTYKTYDWLAGTGKAGGFDNAIMSGRVTRAVEAELAAKGFRRSLDAEPDFRVGYSLPGRGNRSRQAHLGLGLGMGPLGIGVGAPVGDRHVETVGSIVLEIQDARSRAMVWKATAEGALNGNDSPEESDAIVVKAVHNMFNRFPPKK